MPNPTSFDKELTAGDRFTLDRAAEAANSDWPADTVGRYSFYRRRGYDKSESISFAIIWAKNIAEQATRRRRSA